MATTWKVKSCWNHLVYLKGISKRKSMVNFAAKVWLQVHFWLLSQHYFITSSLPSFRNSHTFFWSSIPVLAIKWWTVHWAHLLGWLRHWSTVTAYLVHQYPLLSRIYQTWEENRVDEKNVLNFSIRNKTSSFILWFTCQISCELHVSHKQKTASSRGHGHPRHKELFQIALFTWHKGHMKHVPRREVFKAWLILVSG